MEVEPSSGYCVRPGGAYKDSYLAYDCSVSCGSCWSMQALSEDYTKLVTLHAGRSVKFHSKGGAHNKTRIPKHGRDLVYHPTSCDLYLAASSPELYRFNLDQGGISSRW